MQEMLIIANQGQGPLQMWVFPESGRQMNSQSGFYVRGLMFRVCIQRGCTEEQ